MREYVIDERDVVDEDVSIRAVRDGADVDVWLVGAMGERLWILGTGHAVDAAKEDAIRVANAIKTTILALREPDDA